MTDLEKIELLTRQLTDAEEEQKLFYRINQKNSNRLYKKADELKKKLEKLKS